MGRYLVIENEPKLFELVQVALKAIDSSADIVHFENFHLLENKFKLLPEDEKNAFYQFNLLVLSFADMPLKDWKKDIDELKKNCAASIPICLTSFESNLINLHFLKQLEVYNIIYKPFDPLILKETISLALQKEKLAKTFEMKSQKSSTYIGVLKEVELQSISELGFLTLSDAPIPTSSLTKYFSPLFTVNRKQSVWAQCLVSTPHPQKPGLFINKFQFYHVKKDFLNAIRKYILNFKAQETSPAFWNLATLGKPQKFKMALIAMKNRENDTYQKEIEGHFKNLQVEFLDFAIASSWPEKLDHDLVLNLTDLSTETLKKYFKESTRYFWLPSIEPKEADLKDLALTYLEIFTQPYDRSYFYKKLKILVNELEPSEVPYLLNVTCHDKIKALNTIKVTEINEVFINFQYSRELEFNCFREFMFLTDEDDIAIEVPAFCHFKEKGKNLPATEKNIYFHQFAFYAMTDHFLKEIRLWLMHNHILQSKKEN